MEEPDWIKEEREQFASHRDKDKDGFMDKEEVLDWILPVSYDHYEAEAKHLIQGADGDEVPCSFFFFASELYLDLCPSTAASG